MNRISIDFLKDSIDFLKNPIYFLKDSTDFPRIPSTSARILLISPGALQIDCIYFQKDSTDLLGFLRFPRDSMDFLKDYTPPSESITKSQKNAIN